MLIDGCHVWMGNLDDAWNLDCNHSLTVCECDHAWAYKVVNPLPQSTKYLSTRVRSKNIAQNLYYMSCEAIFVRCQFFKNYYQMHVTEVLGHKGNLRKTK